MGKSKKKFKVSFEKDGSVRLRLDELNLEHMKFLKDNGLKVNLVDKNKNILSADIFKDKKIDEKNEEITKLGSVLLEKIRKDNIQELSYNVEQIYNIILEDI